MELYPHQRAAVEQLENGKILWGDVGVGKTLTALAYYYEKVCGGTTGKIGSMTKPRDLIVITTAKKRDSMDWQKDAAMFGISTKREFSVDGITITVDSWNNIQNYVEAENVFFIFDEQRVVGSGAWTKSFIRIAKHNQWIMLSATPGDTWLDYIPVFIANGWYKNKTDFTRQHVVFSYYQKFPKVERYLATQRLVRQRNNILVEMPFIRHTTRNFHMVDVDYDTKLFERVWKDRWHVYENRPLRDVAELFIVMRKVVNSDSSRLRAVQDLMHTHPKLIVFYNFDYELEELRKLSRNVSEPLTSSSSPQKASPRPPKLPTTSASITQKSISLEKTDPSGLTTFSPTSENLLPSSQTISTSTSTSTTTRSSSSGKSCPENLATSSLSGPADSAGSTGTTMTTAQPIPTTGERSTSDCSPGLSTSEDGSLRPKTSTTSSNVSVGSDRSTASDTTSECDTSKAISTEESSFAVAEWNGHKHEPIPETDSWVYLVQYVAGAEGWNCVETNAVCFYSLTYSYKNFYQCQGRIDRLNTPFKDLHYYVLKSKSLIDTAVWRSLKGKKSFNQAKTGVKL